MHGLRQENYFMLEYVSLSVKPYFTLCNLSDMFSHDLYCWIYIVKVYVWITFTGRAVSIKADILGYSIVSDPMWRIKLVF